MLYKAFMTLELLSGKGAVLFFFIMLKLIGYIEGENTLTNLLYNGIKI